MTDQPKAEAFVQWKGTDACIDLQCGCGAHVHYDGAFAYHVRCDNCGAVYEMPHMFQLVGTAVPPDVDDDHGAKIAFAGPAHSDQAAEDSALLDLPVYAPLLACDLAGCPCGGATYDWPGEYYAIREIAEAIRQHQNDNPIQEPK